jgi:hypothetical protein
MCIKHFIKCFILVFYSFSIFSSASLAQSEETSLNNFVRISNYNNLSYSSHKQTSTDNTRFNSSLVNAPPLNLFEKYHYSQLNLKEDVSEVFTPLEAPYAVILKHNSAFAGTGLTLYGTSALLKSYQKPLSKEKIEDLNLNGI